MYVRGWRPVMYVYGLAGILVAGIFWFYFRDRPPTDWASRTGLLRIDGSEKPSWRALLRLGSADASGPSVFDRLGGAVHDVVTKLVNDSPWWTGSLP